MTKAIGIVLIISTFVLAFLSMVPEVLASCVGSGC
jgi:hypothetical protein